MMNKICNTKKLYSVTAFLMALIMALPFSACLIRRF